jgi:hypothetical protein
MIVTRKQYLNYLKSKRLIEFVERNKTSPSHTTADLVKISIHDYSDPANFRYDKKFMRTVLAGMKFAGVSHDNHDITQKQLEALINFFQVCSWTDFYIVFKLFPYMPLIIMVIQLFTLVTLIFKVIKV